MATVELNERVQTYLRNLKSHNNSLVDLANAIKNIKTKVDGLTAGQKSAADAAIADMGVDAAAVDALLTALDGVATNVQTNLAAIKQDI